jgi:photosystem II stability/assembly factor-like uncharacterized protein
LALRESHPAAGNGEAHRVWGVVAVKKVLPCITLVGLLVLALGGTAGANPPPLASLATAVVGTTQSTPASAWAAPTERVNPMVSGITPALAPNDLDATVTITGTGFAAVMSGAVVLTPPTVSLGSQALTNVTFVSSSTLTATVPWGLSAGSYPLTVVNPDGGTGTLASAFAVAQAIGQWNAGDLFGGDINQLLLKPGDPNTIYALAYGVVGLFRSVDAGEHWAMVSDKVWANNNAFATDSLHPDWLYSYAPNGLMRSQDGGVTWTTLTTNKWPDERDVQSPQVYVSPYQDLPAHPQALFVSSSAGYGTSNAAAALGLIKSIDGGATWAIVPSLEGIPVQDIAFDPSDHAHMVAATSDVNVYQSNDWGDHWTRVTTDLPSSLTSLGMQGSIMYNPYKAGEAWLVSQAPPTGGGIFKSTDGSLTNWLDESWLPGSGYTVSFTGPDSVFCWQSYSIVGGKPWQHPFGPVTMNGNTAILFDPRDPQTAYISDSSVGVRKTTDGGVTWQNKIDGLTGLRCFSMAVSPADPLRVYAVFDGPPGIYRSDDGTGHWSYLPIAGIANVRQVLADPIDAQRVSVGADSGLYVSSDKGQTWSGMGWNLPPASPSGLFVTMAADPFQAGHLLASFGGGNYGIGPGWLYSSPDYGASWTAITVNSGSGVQWIHRILFDPQTPGTVYLTTDGVYKSTDHGGAWQRIDDSGQPDMASAYDIAIATHPQKMLFVGVAGLPYRSLDGGTTWRRAQNWPGGYGYLFADGDSTRLYAGSATGLWFSGDAGDSWERAAGVLGQVQTTVVAAANADGHTILYAATSGGDAVTGGAARAARTTRASSHTLVGAGIYRFVQLPAPAISSFTPASGTEGTVVTLTGTRFTAVSAVAFNGTPAATLAASSDTRITATVPAGATSGAITVTTPGGSVTSTTRFTVVVTPNVTLKLTGLKKGVLKLGKRVTATGKVTPTILAHGKITLTVQKKKGAKWVKVRTVQQIIGATGVYSWKYKPAKKGVYRLQATIAKAATHTAGTTKWLTFKVK